MSYNLRLLISCPDKKGLIAAISSFIAMNDGNILSADQYVSDSGTFFMRLEIEGGGFGLGRNEFAGAFTPLARRHGMDWRISYTDTPKRMAILVSRYDHCLIDLLWRWDAGELEAQIPLVVSNLPNLEARAASYGIPSTTCRSRRRPKRSRSPGYWTCSSSTASTSWCSPATCRS
jgi:formyltetrahydrofolate deformylase